MSSQYDSLFFTNISDTSSSSAKTIAPLLIQYLQPKSVLDIGCGKGSWLSAFESLGVSEILGVDGTYVDQSSLEIKPDQFLAADLNQPLNLARRFDLAVCLEVGEHLLPASADCLIDSVVRHSDAVLFSAAVPRQGGTNHVNEQWPHYWSEKFSARGYRCFDCIRSVVWDEPTVARWFKQNTFLYLSQRMIIDPSLLKLETAVPPSLIHPDSYIPIADALASLLNLQHVPSLKWAGRAFIYATRSFLKRHAGSGSPGAKL